MVCIVSSIDASVQIKCAMDAAVVVHLQIWISPMPAHLDARAVIGYKPSGQGGPVVHIKNDGFSVSGNGKVSTHAATKVHAKSFALGRAQVADTAQVRRRQNSAPSSK